MTDQEPKQAKFGDDGDLEVGDEEDDTNETDDIMRDDGQELDKYETCGGFNRYEVSSLFQKAVRRSDRELAMWGAYEMCRSGYGWNYWDRVQTIMIEDLRLGLEDANIPAAIYNLMQLSKNKWSMDEGMGVATAMRAASLLAEAESSHESLLIKNYWNDLAEERLEMIEDGEEPPADKDFPVDRDEFGDLGYQVLDMHTYTGKKYNRNFAHFLIESSRTSEMSDLEKKYKEKKMRNQLEERYDFSDDQIANAIEPTGRGDEQWEGNKVGFPTDDED